MAQDSIKAEVLDAIKAWRTGQPPISMADLVLAAFLAVGENGLTKTEIIQWIYDHFEHYHQIGVSTMAALTTRDNRFRTDPSLAPFNHFSQEFNSVFSTYGAPIWHMNGYREHQGLIWQCDRISAAYIWRQHTIYREKIDSSPFRFLDLPSEVRNTIYDLVFQYPSSGLCRNSYNKAFHARTGCSDFPFNFNDWIRPAYLPLVQRNHPFALLQACRQIYDEASPCFLAINLLYFKDLQSFMMFWAKITRKQAQHVTRIALVCSHSSTREALEAFQKLVELPKLTELRLNMDEANLVRNRVRRIPPEPSIEDACARVASILKGLPCFHNIRIVGTCPLIRKLLHEPAQFSGANNRKSGKKASKLASRRTCRFCKCSLRQYLTPSGNVKYNCTGRSTCPGRRALR